MHVCCSHRRRMLPLYSIVHLAFAGSLRHSHGQRTVVEEASSAVAAEATPPPVPVLVSPSVTRSMALEAGRVAVRPRHARTVSLSRHRFLTSDTLIVLIAHDKTFLYTDEFHCVCWCESCVRAMCICSYLSLIQALVRAMLEMRTTSAGKHPPLNSGGRNLPEDLFRPAAKGPRERTVIVIRFRACAC